jgi:hypothetical protein
MSDNISLQYVYLLQEREFIKTSENIYKIGRTTQKDMKRFNGYPKGSHLIAYYSCTDCVMYENMIKIMFKKKYTQRRDIGIEYFEGNCDAMRNDIQALLTMDDKEIINQTYEKEELIIDSTEKIILEVIKNQKKCNNSIDTEKGLKSRLQILGITELELINDKDLCDIVKDDDKFSRCVKSIILYYTKEVVDKKAMTEFVENFSFIGKSNRLFRLFRILTTIVWLENELGIDRFEFVEMKVAKPKALVSKMLNEISKFQWLSHKTTELARKEEITKRINKLTTEDRVNKFCMDIINQFDEFYSYKIKETGRNKIAVYYDFEFNKKIITNHIMIINYLKMEPDKFLKIIKSKIYKTDLIENLEFIT